MSFKEEQQKSYPHRSFYGEKKDFHLNHVNIHVVYVKKFLSKIDIWGYPWKYSCDMFDGTGASLMRQLRWIYKYLQISHWVKNVSLNSHRLTEKKKILNLIWIHCWKVLRCLSFCSLIVPLADKKFHLVYWMCGNFMFSHSSSLPQLDNLSIFTEIVRISFIPGHSLFFKQQYYNYIEGVQCALVWTISTNEIHLIILNSSL